VGNLFPSKFMESSSSSPARETGMVNKAVDHLPRIHCHLSPSNIREHQDHLEKRVVESGIKF
jgi:hypothetical protein